MFNEFLGPERPLSWALKFWPVPVISFACALIATWLCRKVALKFGIVDKPDDTVKTHKEPVAYLGGIGILAGLTFGILAGLYILRDQQIPAETMKRLFGILAGAAIACLVGLLDDIFDISPGKKVLGQTAAALVLIVTGTTPALRHLTTPFGWDMPYNIELVLGAAVVIFFVLGASNSLNLLDGLDGLCAGVTAIITLAMLLLAIILGTWQANAAGDPVLIILPFALLAAVCGFLPFNYHPAKIFMGDAGSLLLGLNIAAIMILFSQGGPQWWLASVFIFAFPIMDTSVAVTRRLINKRPIFVSDRGHIYDQLMDRGMSLRKTIHYSYALTALYAFFGLVISRLNAPAAGVVCVAVVIVSAFVAWRKGYLKMQGLRGMAPKSDERG